MTRVDVEPQMLRWARERAGISVGALRKRFPKLEAWESRESRPTLKQLEQYAKSTHAPIGYLFLAEPPVETVPIPDFRTIRDERLEHPSPDLLETIYVCQQRQAWYREHARTEGAEPVGFVGSARTSDDIEATAAQMRDALDFDLDTRRDFPTWTEALRSFIEQADELGVLVMVSGVVLNNNRRKLDPDEFRGFAIADDLAPLVFVNGADTKAAQMFTLAHELAHLWLGQSALTDATAETMPDDAMESWCNRVAAELLVPLNVLRRELRRTEAIDAEVSRLARRFKVSTLVVLRRIYDAGALSRQAFWEAYEAEVARLRSHARTSGGDFYLTQAARVSKRFARALVASTREGQTLYRDAFRLLGISKVATLEQLGRSLEPSA